MGRDQVGPDKFMIRIEQGVMMVTLAGKLTVDTMRSAIEAILVHPEFRPGLDAIWDFREAALDELYLVELREISEQAARFDDVRGFHRTAAVTKREADFGIVRMYEALAQPRAHEVRAFRSVKEARDWLKEPPEETHVD